MFIGLRGVMDRCLWHPDFPEALISVPRKGWVVLGEGLLVSEYEEGSHLEPPLCTCPQHARIQCKSQAVSPVVTLEKAHP